jgi:uncharacterized LabA/DUF88 family protein
MDDRMRIALLIDADNASASTLEYVLGEIANLGVANVRRAYGDWAIGSLKSWRDALLDNAIQPMQQIAYAKKGNASDMAMIVDAMDLLYTGRFDAFALMSSDSDFTPLAMRLRAANMQVYGFGKANTPNAFKAACSTFFLVDAADDPAPPEETQTVATAPAPVDTAKHVAGPVVMAAVAAATTKSAMPRPKSSPAQPPAKRTGAQLRSDTALVNLLHAATEAAKDEDGWSKLSKVGNHIANRGSFTPKNYGYRTLKPLIVATELFTLHTDGNHVRAKAAKGAKKKPGTKS